MQLCLVLWEHDSEQSIGLQHVVMISQTLPLNFWKTCIFGAGKCLYNCILITVSICTNSYSSGRHYLTYFQFFCLIWGFNSFCGESELRLLCEKLKRHLSMATKTIRMTEISLYLCFSRPIPWNLKGQPTESSTLNAVSSPCKWNSV